jgi:hypothetical protein
MYMKNKRLNQNLPRNKKEKKLLLNPQPEILPYIKILLDSLILSFE